MVQKVFIIGAKRSPIGSFLGALKDVHPVDLGVQVLKPLLEKTNVPVDQIDEVIIGNVLSAGIGQGIARQVSIKSGIPVHVPAYSVNMICGSGMKSVINGYVSIASGLSNLIVAGGVESMSFAPYLIPGKARDGMKMSDFTVVDHMINEGLTDAFSKVHMGITAENIVDQYQISRNDQEQFALDSQQKAIKAVDDGVFDDEIQPIEIMVKKDIISFAKDEYPNRTTSLEKMAKLRPAFKPDGAVTAATSSGINDGASFVILASEAMVKEHNLPILAEIVSVGQGGVDPSVMGLGPIPAIRAALKQANLPLSSMELVELNEAFAAQSLGVIDELTNEYHLDKQAFMKNVNVNGGAIALGHPIGASGNRILVTLLYEMMRRNTTYGLASLCIGGGMGTAVIVKR